MLSNTSATSIESFIVVEQTSGFDNGLTLVSNVLEILGPSTVDEIRQHILLNYKTFIEKGKDEIGARVADAWRINGSVRQTRVSRISKFSGKKGNVWEYVHPYFREQAKKEYWQSRITKLEEDYKKAKTKLSKELALIQI